jgi:hypothetical protein
MLGSPLVVNFAKVDPSYSAVRKQEYHDEGNGGGRFILPVRTVRSHRFAVKLASPVRGVAHPQASSCGEPWASDVNASNGTIAMDQESKAGVVPSDPFASRLPWMVDRIGRSQNSARTGRVHTWVNTRDYEILDP